jgi:hypothetical protein
MGIIMKLSTKIKDDKNNVLLVLDGEWRFPSGEVHQKPQPGFESLFDHDTVPWAAVDFVYDETGYEFEPCAFEKLSSSVDETVLVANLCDMHILDDYWSPDKRIRWFPSKNLPSNMLEAHRKFCY